MSLETSYARNNNFEEKFSAILCRSMGGFLQEAGCVMVGLKTALNTESGHDVQRAVQGTAGDFLIYPTNNLPGGFTFSVDMKVERRASRNLFFETASNAVLHDGLNGFTPGWGISIKSQALWYVFSDAMVLAEINLPALRAWLMERVPFRATKKLRYMTYHEVLQNKHKQANCTVGRLIPFRDLPEGVWSQSYRISNTSPALLISREEFLEAILGGRDSHQEVSIPPRTQPDDTEVSSQEADPSMGGSGLQRAFTGNSFGRIRRSPRAFE